MSIEQNINTQDNISEHAQNTDAQNTDAQNTDTENTDADAENTDAENTDADIVDVDLDADIVDVDLDIDVVDADIVDADIVDADIVDVDVDADIVDVDVDVIDSKDIIVRINKLTQKEKIHILNILKTQNVEFTKNANGYFFNLLKMNKDIVNKICNCLELIEKNTDLLKEMDRRRNELLKYYRLLIEDKFKNNIKKKKQEYLDQLIVKDYTNVEYNIKRKKIIKRRLKYINSEIDTDILMKEYIKSKYKYKKDSIYHRIITSIKLIKSNKGREKKSNDDDENIDDKESGYDNVNGDDDKESIADITEDDSFNINQDDTNTNEENENEENDQEDEIDIDNLLGKVEYDNEDDENDQEDEIDIDNQVLNEEKTEMEFLYYKKLLNKQGFMFDENKDVILEYNEYIN
jgi:hypothetical protein